MALPLGIFGAGCGRTDLTADVPSNETDSTTVSMEDDGNPTDDEEEGEVDTGDWGEEEGEWGEEEEGEWGEEEWGEEEEGEWGEEEWGEEEEGEWGEEEWGEEEEGEWGETDWGEEEGTTDTTTTDTGTTEDTGETTEDTGETTEDTGETTEDTGETDTGGDLTCSESTECLFDCGDYSDMCVGPCTDGLEGEELDEFFDLQICALQFCFFEGACGFNFNEPECVECRLDASIEPGICAEQTAACGL